ncbi:hypothetical protein TorRG33x02_200380 [Trema orientale]|uniref:Uncharacterized protein n=1 Tax=Trema orientale TaxID=63057 RepID=A0A2P5EF34_TREOI|nr:hypothetical protein TorRG33x02_200380 [Trema orientale]
MSKLIIEDEFKFTLIVLWIIWFERNKVVHREKRKESALVASWAERFYEEVPQTSVLRFISASWNAQKPTGEFLSLGLRDTSPQHSVNSC